jgi:hypothetical protein
MYQKFKLLLADDAVMFALVLVLVAVCSFGFGRLSVTDNRFSTNQLGPQVGLVSVANPPSIVASSSTTATTTPSLSVAGPDSPYVGSKSGTKYHLITCPGAKQIKAENKIFFATVRDAAAAGYTPAANCPGL